MSFFTKTNNRKASVLGVDTNGRGRIIRKGYRRLNMVEIFCTHIYKWKNETY
jgi:hypothetical protein